MHPSDIASLWHQVNRQLHEILRETAQGFGLTPMAYHVMRAIRCAPGITLSELARRIGGAKGHISTLIDQLVQAEHVEKRSDPHDQRLTRLHLTPAAHRLLADMNQNAERAWSAVFASFSPQELQQFSHSLRKLMRGLEEVHTVDRRACP